jgi:hypothetical protein
MAPLTDTQLRQFARLGAMARLAQLDAEIAAIKAAYPDLGTSGKATKRTRAGAARKRAGRRVVAKRAVKRGGSHMSPAARKAASVRMKKYWAERRKAAAK